MDYLRGNATASATGLFVVCRHLSRLDAEQSVAELRGALQPLRAQRSKQSDAGRGDVLEASLSVGEGIGILQKGSGETGWTVEPEFRRQLESRTVDAWPWFRGELLYRMNQDALGTIGRGEKPPDLLLGMAWFLQRNPLEPLQAAWGGGPEAALDALGLKAIDSPEQWRAFTRWALAVGLARSVESGSSRVLVPDASTAIADQFESLPAIAIAPNWLRSLTKRLPVLGSPELLAALPQGQTPWSEIPPALSLGLLKLEKAGRLRLEPSDDAAEIVTIGLNAQRRQVGRIGVTGDRS